MTAAETDSAPPVCDFAGAKGNDHVDLETAKVLE